MFLRSGPLISTSLRNTLLYLALESKTTWILPGFLVWYTLKMGKYQHSSPFPGEETASFVNGPSVNKKVHFFLVCEAKISRGTLKRIIPCSIILLLVFKLSLSGGDKLTSCEVPHEIWNIVGGITFIRWFGTSGVWIGWVITDNWRCVVKFDGFL